MPTENAPRAHARANLGPSDRTHSTGDVRRTGFPAPRGLPDQARTHEKAPAGGGFCQEWAPWHLWRRISSAPGPATGGGGRPPTWQG